MFLQKKKLKHMFRKNLKKRAETPILINFQDFVQIRSQKEKVINNPFEQNWKKTIIMDQLLALYKPHVGGVPPSTNTCTKNQYIVQYPLRFTSENEDTQWNNNQQSQLNKYYKMADGINRWEQMFQRDHIEQAACKIQKKKLGDRKKNIVSQIQVQNKKYRFKKKRIHQHFNNSSLTGFTNLLRFSQNSLRNKKYQVQIQNKIAVKHYGLSFKENWQQNEIQLNLQEFKKKDKEIFATFMTKMHPNPKISQKQHQNTINCNIPQSLQLKRSYPYSVLSSPMRQFPMPKSAQCSRKKHYVRIVFD